MSDELSDFYILLGFLIGGILFCRFFSRLVVWDHNRSRRAQLSTAAEQGDAAACHTLAMALLADSRTPENARRAVDLLCRAAAAGHAEALADLAECYLQGIGVEQNFSRAEKLWKQALDAGYREPAGSSPLSPSEPD